MMICDAQVHIWAANTPERPWPARAEPHRAPLGKEELPHFVRHLHTVAMEMDKFMLELNQVYDQKRRINSLNIDFSSLVDKRNSLFNQGSKQ